MVKFDRQDGLINCLLDYLQEKPIQHQYSKIGYYNQLMENENKMEIFEINDSQFHESLYYPSELAHWASGK